jgi:hypothetical protein
MILKADSIVYTKNGIKPISMIRADDLLFDGTEYRRLGVTKIGESKCIRIDTEYGLSIAYKDALLFKSLDFNKTVSYDIAIGDKIVCSRGVGFSNNSKSEINSSVVKYLNGRFPKIKTPNEISIDLMYLIGYSYGDGNVDVDCLSLACGNDHPYITCDLESISITELEYAPKILPGDGNLVKLSIHSKQFIEFLRENDILKDKAGSIKFPYSFNFTTDLFAAFYSGLFDADGYASGSKKGYALASVDLDLLIGIKLYLATYGIVSKIHKEDRSKMNWRDLYSLCVLGSSSQSILVERFNRSHKIKNLSFVSKRD